MAMDRVFGTAELADMILIQLPMRNLLLSQRVCRKWKYAIRNSPQLQRALFLKPASDDVAYYLTEEICRYHGTRRTTRRIDFSRDLRLGGLKHYIRGFYVLPQEMQYLPSAAYTHGLSQLPLAVRAKIRKTNVFLNPLLQTVVDALRHLEEHRIRLDTVFRPEASWRRMFLSQPPLGCISLRGREWLDVPGVVYDQRMPNLVLNYDVELLPARNAGHLMNNLGMLLCSAIESSSRCSGFMPWGNWTGVQDIISASMMDPHVKGDSPLCLWPKRTWHGFCHDLRCEHPGCWRVKGGWQHWGSVQKGRPIRVSTRVWEFQLKRYDAVFKSVRMIGQ